MGDVELDLTALRVARIRADAALATFRDADGVSDELADLTGDPGLAGRVRDFADNWDYNRVRLMEQLTDVRNRLEAIVDSFTDLDQQAADSLGDGRR